MLVWFHCNIWNIVMNWLEEHATQGLMELNHIHIHNVRTGASIDTYKHLYRLAPGVKSHIPQPTTDKTELGRAA